LRLAVLSSRQDRRVAPIVPPKTWPSGLKRPQGHAGQDDNLEACPPVRPSQSTRGVEVRTKQVSPPPLRCAESQVRSSPVYAGHTIKPLRKFIFPRKAPAVSDRIEVFQRAGKPLSVSPPKAMKAFLPFERPLRMSRDKE